MHIVIASIETELGLKVQEILIYKTVRLKTHTWY